MRLEVSREKSIVPDCLRVGLKVFYQTVRCALRSCRVLVECGSLSPPTADALFRRAAPEPEVLAHPALHDQPRMKIRAAKKKQNKKVKAAKARAKHAREQRKKAAAGAGRDGDDDHEMDAADAEVNAADEDVAIAEAVSENPKLSGRAARALAVQARRTLKQKLSQLKDQRQKIAKKSIARRDERKALGAKIKAAFQVSKNNSGDADALLRAAEDLPDDDDDDDNWADEDVEMAMD